MGPMLKTGYQNSQLAHHVGVGIYTLNCVCVSFLLTTASYRTLDRLPGEQLAHLVGVGIVGIFHGLLFLLPPLIAARLRPR